MRKKTHAMRQFIGALCLMAAVMLTAIACGTKADGARHTASDGDLTSYYRKADGLTGEELKTALSTIIYNRHELTYKSIWEAFRSTDLRPDGTVWDIYSGITAYSPVGGGTAFHAEGDCYNREHTFPASWFGRGTPPMQTDLHHIFPTDGYVNDRRGNLPYGETQGEKYRSAEGFSKVGRCTRKGYNGLVFEPNDEYKGDLARTYFYMVTCYESKLPDWRRNGEQVNGVMQTLDGNTYPGLTKWQLEMLMQWAADDPVSTKETTRNAAIYRLQGNRNPFVDYPGLERYIWGDRRGEPFSSKGLTP